VVSETEPKSSIDVIREGWLFYGIAVLILVEYKHLGFCSWFMAIGVLENLVKNLKVYPM
jgi:hypothetical protein